jgi:hypothetical protein
MICAAPQPPIMWASEVTDEFDLVVCSCEVVSELKNAKRRCLNPCCFGGNVVLPVSGRLAVCASCDGAGGYGTVREARERYYRGRSTAMTLALQSLRVIDEGCESHISNMGLDGVWP